MLLMSVDTLVRISIKVPVVGALRDVIPVLVCEPAELNVLTNVAQLVAVTVAPTDTADTAVWPQPDVVAPVDQNRFNPVEASVVNPL
jgi:hypothetical protein